MSNPWFRFYSAAIRHPKVAKLPDNDFRLWLNLLSVACENNGFIPPLEDLKHVLNARLDHLLRGIERLISALLIDRLEVGYTPHNWTKKQFISDTSAPRVTLHRKKHAVTVTPPDTEQNRTDADIRKKEPKKVLSKEKRGTRLPDDFEPDGTCWAVAEELLLTTRQSQTEFEKFKDYWKGKAGAAGVKLDWQATFRNWLRNSKTQGTQYGNHQTNNKPNSIAGSLEIANAAVDAILEREAKREAGISASDNKHDFISLPRLHQGNA